MKTINFKSPCHFGDDVYFIITKIDGCEISHEQHNGTVHSFVIRSDGIRVGVVCDNFMYCIPLECISLCEKDAKNKMDKLTQEDDNNLIPSVDKRIISIERTEVLISDKDMEHQITIKSYQPGDPMITCHGDPDVVMSICVTDINRIWYYGKSGLYGSPKRNNDEKDGKTTR